MNMYDGANDPDVGVGDDRRYFDEGAYRLKIDVIKEVTPQKAFDGIGSFVGEFIVLQSTNPMILPGAVVGWVEKLKPKTRRMSFANIKGFIAAAFGVNADGLSDVARAIDDPTDPRFKCVQRDSMGRIMAGGDGQPLPDFGRLFSALAGPANPLQGQTLDLICTLKKLSGGGVFTKHHWHALGALDDRFGPSLPV